MSTATVTPEDMFASANMPSVLSLGPSEPDLDIRAFSENLPQLEYDID